MALECRPILKLPEDVINKIAAGEVIQRPVNALKELLENSLDAGATNVQIVVKNGGLKLLQIQDNGSGIKKDDFPVVCQRFTTSKLREFEDLHKLSTYGFRGEALSSISHVAHLTITSKTKDDVCAYQGSFVDGKLEGKAKPLAGNQGTIITVEDLFYNLTVRKNAMRSSSEEYQKISDMVSKYAVHNAHVGFALKKSGGNNDIKTPLDSNHIDNIRIIYGNLIARELVEFNFENTNLRFKVDGYFTNVNYSTKKFNFLLFINHRLVECSRLKKSLDYVFESYLPKHQHPFIYLSLEIDPNNLDVNCHPTKHEVHFLNEEQIIDDIVTAVEKKLVSSNNSRVFYIQTKLPGISFEEPSIIKDGKSIPVYPKDMVRTDPKTQKLDKFFDTSITTKKEKPKFDISMNEEELQKHHEEFMKKNEEFENKCLNKAEQNVCLENKELEDKKNKDIVEKMDESIEKIEEIPIKCFSTPKTEKTIAVKQNNQKENPKGIHKSFSEEAYFSMPSTSKAIDFECPTKRSDEDIFDAEPGTSAHVEDCVLKLDDADDIVFEHLNIDEKGGLVPDEILVERKNVNADEKECNDIIEDTEEVKVKKMKIEPNLIKGKQIEKPLNRHFIAKVTKVETKLTSVLELRKEVEDSCHRQLRETFAQHVFVGSISPAMALIQYSTKLLLCNTEKILSEIFYQFILYNFQNFDCYEFEVPLSIHELAILCLEQPESGWSEEDGPKEQLAERVSEILVEKAPMLKDYFSIEITGDGGIKTLPVLLEGYIPNPAGLPMYVTRLATEVNWEEEKPCFEGFARETGKYYANVCDDTDDNGKDWKWVTEFVLYPAIKNYLIPPKSFIDNKIICEVANLPNLYKIFERC